MLLDPCVSKSLCDHAQTGSPSGVAPPHTSHIQLPVSIRLILIVSVALSHQLLVVIVLPRVAETKTLLHGALILPIRASRYALGVVHADSHWLAAYPTWIDNPHGKVRSAFANLF